VKHFGRKSLSSFGITNNRAGVIAAGAVIYYLTETQKTDLNHITTLKYYDLNGEMILDSSTLKNLDIISSQSETGNKTSLVELLDRTQTSLGSRKIRKWVIHPLLDVRKINERQKMVEQLFGDLSILNKLREELKKVSDLERISSRIGLNRATARDLIGLSSTINQVLSISDILEENKLLPKQVREIKSVKSKVKDLTVLIDNSITDNPPNSITEGHIIREGYDKDIDKLKNKTKDSKDWIENLQKTERERTKIPSLKVKFNKVFGYYIEVTNTHKDKVPDDYIRKQTLVNCERFITPDLKDREEIILNAQEKLNKLEYEAFQDIREKIFRYFDSIQSLSDNISEIDVISSLAHVANQNNYCKPEILDFGKEDGIIEITNGRHPVIEYFSDEEFVSNNSNMNLKDRRIIILTGPNMSGKSTYIRQVALILLMAQIGSYVPASSAKISLTDRVFTRVGASLQNTAL
jgi:DNA mismatch repair protein MutS